MKDPRIRGVCPVTPDLLPRRVRPALDCSGQCKGTGFRKGSLVKYRGRLRYVLCVNYYNQLPRCQFEAGQRIVTTLNLGSGDNNIPWDKVELVCL